MKYIITESQYKLITEEEDDVLYIPSVDALGGWDNLQKFLERRGNPDYRLGGSLVNSSYTVGSDLENIESLGNCIAIDGRLSLS